MHQPQNDETCKSYKYQYKVANILLAPETNLMITSYYRKCFELKYCIAMK